MIFFGFDSWYYKDYFKKNFERHKFRKVSFGSDFVNIVCDDGVYYCEFLDPISPQIPIKLVFSGKGYIKKIASGEQHTIAICDNNLYTWGINIYDVHAPNRILFFDDKNIRKIACGSYHSIVVCDDGVYAWGGNIFGQLGIGNIRDTRYPVKIDFFDGKHIRKIRCGKIHNIAVCDDGVYIWGNNETNQLGINNILNAEIPMKLNFFNGKYINKIACGGFHNIVVCNDGVYVWGANYSGQLGKGDLIGAPTPFKIDFNQMHVQKISCGYHHTIAVCDNGVFGWGNNAYKQLGINDLHKTLSPIRLEQFDDKIVDKIFCRYNFSLFDAQEYLPIKAAIPTKMK